jgi:rsbT co-antagonist protein RsbR
MRRHQVAIVTGTATGEAGMSIEALQEQLVAMEAANQHLMEEVQRLEQELDATRRQIAQAHAPDAGAADSPAQAETRPETDTQRLRYIMDSLLDGLFIVEEGRLVDANQAAAKMLGYTIEAMIGISVLELIAPQSRELVRENMHIDEVYSYEAWAQHQDGSQFMIEVSARTIELQGRRQRIAIVRDISKRKETEAGLRMYQTIVENAPDGIAIADLDGVMQYCNSAISHMVGYADLTGHSFYELYADADIMTLQQYTTELLKRGSTQARLNWQHAAGSVVPVNATMFTIHDARGNPHLTACIARDISREEAAEAERAALQQQVIEAQQVTLRELSNPLLPISDNVVIMPLIGNIDSRRAQTMLEGLLEGVAEHQAELVILDITGVRMVDTQVAQAFIQAAQAVRLLGAQVILTGIQPQIAQTLIHLGVDMNIFQTFGNLQAGIASALQVE